MLLWMSWSRSSLRTRAAAGDHGEEEGLPGAGVTLEDVTLQVQRRGIRLPDEERRVGELHLTEVDRIVSAVDEQVDLGTAVFFAAWPMPPGGEGGMAQK